MFDWKTAADEFPAALVVIDKYGRVAYINKILSEKGKIDFSEVKERPFRFFAPEEFTKLVNLILKTFEEKRKNPNPAVLLKAVSKTGEEFWLEARTRYAEIGGEPYCLLALTDVTERVRLQREVNSLNEYLKFLNSMLRHDILNVFTRMLLYVELIEEKCKFDEVVKLRENIEAGVSLIRKIRELELSTDQKKELYSLKEVIDEVSKGYNVKVTVNGDAKVLVNQGIFSVFDNLISNAVKHGGASEVRITITEKQKVIVKVEDNGKGIPDRILERIFERGFTTGKGSGLGLYIVKKLVESYGGDIRSEKVDKGAVFVIELPRVKLS